MNKNLNLIFKKVLEKIEPPKEEIIFIKKYLFQFVEELKREIKKHKIQVEVFVGGSFAKKTLIKKDNYDVDIFLRFDKKYKDKISYLTEELIKIKHETICGSRDYFRINVNPHFSIEIVPVIKIKNPKEAENITDLSYSHVKYINSKIKNKKILDEIKIAKAFCYANNSYGAESYVSGFSGYALELLVYYYGNFVNFLKAVVKSNDKIIIDIEKKYKNKAEILMNLNSAKLNSPIILIDPTFKQRNVTAALSEETFKKFKNSARSFLKKPSVNNFEVKKINFEKEQENAKKKKKEFVLLEIKTEKPEGDIAGSKLLKFYRHLNTEISKLFVLNSEKFEYSGEKTAKAFFAGKPKKEILFSGPFISDKENAEKFRKAHRGTFVKNKKIYTREKINLSLKKFLKNWKLKNSRKLKEMHIHGIKIIA